MKGCIGEEARPGWKVWGGRLPVIWGGILIDEKNREMGGPFALDGRLLMEGHNNQPKVGINYGRGIEEERQPGRNVWGGVVSSLGAANRRRKKQQRKCIVALDGRRRMKITQQPTKSTRRDEGGEGGELRLARGAQGKRKSIVWGRSSWVVYQINIKLMCLLKINLSPPDHRVNKKPHNSPSDNLLRRGYLEGIG